MIDYSPLFRTLEDRDITISSLRDHGIHPSIVSKINKNESLTLTQIDRICQILKVPIEKIVLITIDN